MYGRCLTVMTSKCLQALLACSLLLCHHGADTVAAVSPQGSAGPIQLWAAPAEGQQQEHDERDGTQPSQPVRGGSAGPETPCAPRWRRQRGAAAG
jgi:hypothetical protein